MLNNVLPEPDKVPAPTETATASKIAGPTAREPCCMASFSATALGNRSRVHQVRRQRLGRRLLGGAQSAVYYRLYHDVPRIIHAHHYQYGHHRGLRQL